MSDSSKEMLKLEIEELKKQIFSINGAFEELAVELAHEKLSHRELHAQLQDAIKMAIYDPLTGAVTRKEMERQITLSLSSLHRVQKMVKDGVAQTAEPEEFSILFFDLNGLKAVNDSFGHRAGDVLLKTFGTVLRQHFKRETDIVSRWGCGDEFVVLLGGVTPRLKAEAIAEEFLQELTSECVRFSFGKGNDATPREIPLRAAVGVSSTSDGFTTMEELIAAADNELYHHKSVTSGSRR